MNEYETTKFTPEKSKQIALARLDIVHQWLEFRKKSKNKLQADYDFVKLHNTSNCFSRSWSVVFASSNTTSACPELLSAERQSNVRLSH